MLAYVHLNHLYIAHSLLLSAFWNATFIPLDFFSHQLHFSRRNLLRSEEKELAGLVRPWKAEELGVEPTVRDGKVYAGKVAAKSPMAQAGVEANDVLLSLLHRFWFAFKIQKIDAKRRGQRGQCRIGARIGGGNDSEQKEDSGGQAKFSQRQSWEQFVGYRRQF